MHSPRGTDVWPARSPCTPIGLSVTAIGHWNVRPRRPYNRQVPRVLPGALAMKPYCFSRRSVLSAAAAMGTMSALSGTGTAEPQADECAVEDQQRPHQSVGRAVVL